MKKKHLVVDGQVFQSPAWDRGMGKYSLELLKAIGETHEKNWSGLKLILSKKLQANEQMLEVLKEQLPKFEVVFLPLEPNTLDNRRVATKNRVVVDDYISKIAGPSDSVDFLIMSLLQGEIAPVFPSSKAVSKNLIFYDIIPLMMHDVYLRDPISQKRYYTKFAEFLRADNYLAISKTVANDLALFMGLDVKRIHNIDGGAVKHSSKAETHKIDKPFILMPTGNDLRKNNRRAIEGFEAFNKGQRNRFSLVITSNFTDHEVAELSKLSGDLVFTGNISGGELEYLYEHAEALLFPSEYEGLGMPIIEALEKNKPIVCSDIAVFREISDTAFNMFDPFDTSSIASTLKRALSQGSKKPPKQAVEAILSKYTWENAAKKAVKAMRKRSQNHNDKDVKKIAIFASDPEQTVSGQISQLLHSELCRNTQANYFIASETVAEQPPRQNYLSFVEEVHDPRDYFKFADKNQVVIHILSADSHPACLLAALALPGLLVLLDADLSEAWTRALKAGFITKKRYDLEKSYGNKKMTTSLMSTAQGVVEHNTKKTAHNIHSLLWPSVGVVYQEILPRFEDRKPLKMDEVSSLTDFQRLGIFQHTSEVGMVADVSSGQSMIYATEAQVLGAKIKGMKIETQPFPDYILKLQGIISKI